MTPLDVPFKTTLAPIRGVSSWSMTIPLTVIFCAYALKQPINKNAIDQISHLIELQFFILCVLRVLRLQM